MDITGVRGFRTPIGYEVNQIRDYSFVKDMSYSLRVMTFWLVLGVAALIFMLLNLVLGVGNIFIVLVFLAVFLFIVASIFTVRKKKRALYNKIQTGDYKLLDCKIFEVDFSMYLTGEAYVKIFCGDNIIDKVFVCDDSVAREWQADKDIEFVLLNCDNNFYRVLKV